MGTTQQAMDRLPEGFALDVPERDVDTTDGMDGRSLPPVVNRAAVELVPETVDLQRILPDQEMTQPAGDGVRRRSIDDRFHHRWQRIDLAEPGDPGVRLDADQQCVLAPVGLGDVHLRLAQDDGLDIRDLHPVTPSLACPERPSSPTLLPSERGEGSMLAASEPRAPSPI